MALLRDHYEGTEYDATYNHTVGTPNATKYRTICTSSTINAFVVSLNASRPEPLSVSGWLALGKPDTTVFLPIYYGIDALPAGGGIGTDTHDDASMYKQHFEDAEFQARKDGLLNTKVLKLEKLAEADYPKMRPTIDAEIGPLEKSLIAGRAKFEAEIAALYRQGQSGSGAEAHRVCRRRVRKSRRPDGRPAEEARREVSGRGKATMKKEPEMKSGSGRDISRRGFLGAAVAAACGAGLRGAERRPGREQAKEGEAPRIREYRTLGRTEAKVSDISFGAGDLTNANVLAAALDRGVNYIDTAEHYMRGASERAIGEVLAARDRKSVFLTTKLNLAMGGPATKQSLRDRFTKCLERLRTDRADCLMIHMCTLAQVKHEPYHELIAELKAEGKVRFSGLSNHGADYSLHGNLSDPMDEVVLAAAEDGRFDVVLFTYNFIKTDMGERILQACKSKGMGTTLMKMNPAKSGEYEKQVLTAREERLKKQNQAIPESIVKLRAYTDEREAKTAAFLKEHGIQGPEEVRGAAIKFCLSSPDVHCVCPTMNTFEDLDAFTALSGTRLSPKDAAMLSGYTDVFGSLYCRHACGVCEPACPNGVPVNSIMRYDHYFRAQGREKRAMAEYAAVAREHDAGRCGECSGPCEAACPYGVPVRGLLALAHETLSL